MIDVDRPQWWTEAVRAAWDLHPSLAHQLDRLEHAGLAHRREDLRIVLPTGHAVPAGSTIFNVPVIHADVPAPMVALGMMA